MGSIPTRKRPNLLVIVADDLGYSDLGCFGSEIATPSLDRLSQTGVRLTNFHTASACSPTRSMLFSGTDNHIAGLGQMTEHMARFMDNEIIQDAGYHTLMSGKWHLGTTNETSPHARGFDNSYVFLSGCCNHYNYEPQLDDPAHGFFTPMNAGKFWMQDDRFLDRRNPKDIPDDFYSTTTFPEKLIVYLKDRKDTEQPFFAYLPFTAPHWPLQAPRETIEKYKDIYDDGPAALRKRRLANLVKLGLISEDTEPAPLTVELWDKMSPTEKAESARKMEVYAAMVDLIDVNVGRVVDYLDSIDELDNTFVLFMSDNGAEGAMLEAVPMMGSVGSVPKVINKYYNNSIDNMGMADSYIWYGPEWACASMAPSSCFKTWITEGGIRCPCLVRYPPFSKAGGSHTDSFCTVMDILPTVLDLAGIPLPGNKFRGREVFPVRGSSWVLHLEDQSPTFHDEEKEITG
ncbi:Arylsulfatase [Fusarium mundagurra]|uniref:Arylsulfatase n=1 Tax=Fusarium mundagurra TaxID=1567541 RepID=A0A8H5YX88_9HYPO|nr:Arylsulfatase [Fusarium mundagurra]